MGVGVGQEGRTGWREGERISKGEDGEGGAETWEAGRERKEEEGEDMEREEGSKHREQAILF